MCREVAGVTGIEYLEIRARCCNDLLHSRQNLLSRRGRAIHCFAYYLKGGVDQGLPVAERMRCYFRPDLHWYARELDVELCRRDPRGGSGDLHPNRSPQGKCPV